MGVAAWARMAVSSTGRINSVKVPDQLFVNGGHHKYTVTDATFTRLLTESIKVTTTFNHIKVTSVDPTDNHRYIENIMHYISFPRLQSVSPYTNFISHPSLFKYCMPTPEILMQLKFGF